MHARRDRTLIRLYRTSFRQFRTPVRQNPYIVPPKSYNVPINSHKHLKPLCFITAKLGENSFLKTMKTKLKTNDWQKKIFLSGRISNDFKFLRDALAITFDNFRKTRVEIHWWSRLTPYDENLMWHLLSLSPRKLIGLTKHLKSFYVFCHYGTFSLEAPLASEAICFSLLKNLRDNRLIARRTGWTACLIGKDAII